MRLEYAPYLRAKLLNTLLNPLEGAEEAMAILDAYGMSRDDFMESLKEMQFVVEKVKGFGNEKVMLTERGTTFGYSDLVVDYRGIPTMQKNNVPVILDVTHSLQQPNQNSGVTGGLPHLIETIAKAGIAVGVDGLFIETHPNPSVALSDGANMLKLNEMKGLLSKLIKLRKAL
jgi:2-dehydro-3-deoxyphosphooctonate aldolase (KDO 8-P synthase)